MRWQLVSPDALAWRELEGEIVVRNAQTGSTHLLEPFATEVFRLLVTRSEGLSVEELVAAVRGEGDANDEWYALVQTVLAEFKRLGLAKDRSNDRRGSP